MPATRKRQRKNGSVYYEISVSRGYGKSAYTMRWDVPEGLSAKTIKARLQQAAYEFEQDCRAGKVKMRGERKEEERQAAMRRALEAKDRMTVQRFCDETFLPDLRLRCSENTAYNYRLQLEKHIYPDIGQIHGFCHSRADSPAACGKRGKARYRQKVERWRHYHHDTRDTGGLCNHSDGHRGGL